MGTRRPAAAPFFEVNPMKLLTLNTHSLQGEDPRRNLERFVQAALEFRPDVIALQEVNQLRTAAPMDAAGRQGYVLARGNIPLRRGNYAGEAARLLRDTDEKTYRIAEATGYSDPNYFSYVFKRHFGLSPSKFRAGQKG